MAIDSRDAGRNKFQHIVYGLGGFSCVRLAAFFPGNNGRFTIDGILSYVFLVVSYVWKASMLFGPSRNALLNWTRKRHLFTFERAIQRQALSSKGRHSRIAYSLLTSVYILFLAIADFNSLTPDHCGSLVLD